ncbi:MAG TPA: gluconate 2-dehydrogenase subunit 3 family protein [Terriglobia bacterium]|nr:gluconate 2-dehydrogenase subunit 3 family protein [Terriglobia bacterium]
MGGQGIERREMLRVMALAAAASGFPGLHRWTFACGHLGSGAAAARPAAYTPQFFTPAEYATLERLTDMIIPSDGTPGAQEAGVAEFIDFMVWSDPGIQYDFRYGLVWLDSRADTLHGRPFRELTPDRQMDLLGHLAYKARFRPGEEDGQAFFRLAREYTVMGFYTTRIGMEQLDAPGLRFYTESPSCPHHGDPEHRHLPAPQV